MVIGIIGESCTGKSTLAEVVSAITGAEIYSGRDYLRLAKSPSEAEKRFTALLEEHAAGDKHLIYVISEKEHLALLPDAAVRVLMTVDIDTIKARFAARMHGTLPPPVAAMLEKKHGAFDGVDCSLRLDSATVSPEEGCQKLMELLK